MKDIFNEPPRPANGPEISKFADSIIDTASTQQEVDAAITEVEQGWSPSRSVARLAPVSNTHWAALEVLALQLLVDGKVTRLLPNISLTTLSFGTGDCKQRKRAWLEANYIRIGRRRNISPAGCIRTTCQL
jgi:hypothetical protein